MDEEQVNTAPNGPEAQGVSAPENPIAAPTPSQDSVAAESAAPSPQEETPADYQPRYLGKKYSDLATLEDAVSEKDRTINQSNQEKNILAERLSALEQTLKQAGLEPQAVTQTTSQAQPQVDVERLVEQKLRPLRTQMALREEQDAVLEVIKGKPHLAPVASRIIQAWRQSGNESLGAIVKDFEKVFTQGRNASVEDAVVEKQMQVETGRGAGEVTISSTVKRSAALKSGKLEDIAASLPDELSVR
jgi:hypothetical protein